MPPRLSEWSERRRWSARVDPSALGRALSMRTVARLVTVGRDQVSKMDTVTVAAIESGVRILVQACEAVEIAGRETIVVNWVKPPFRAKREILAPANGERDDTRAMSFDTRRRLLIAIGKARAWVDDLISGREADLETPARREGRSERSVSMLLSLAFLAPSLVKAIAENRMPRGIGLTRIADLPSEWPMQWRALALADDASGHAPARA